MRTPPITAASGAIHVMPRGLIGEGPDTQDSALSSARNCISAGTGKEQSETQLAWAHYIIADILNDRGVYTEALVHSREAVSLYGSNAWYFEAEAEALNGLKRPAEAVTASTQALRLSDGRYAMMHFTLGSAYFDEENWALALQSYKKAAELDPHDASSAYNAALCDLRLGYREDAVNWFEEVLKRNPNYPDRDRIRRKSSALSARLY